MTSPLVASPSVLAVETEVTAAVAALVATAPSTLDTLAELAAALGNDPNLSTTLTTLIATKATPADIATAVAAEAAARTTAVTGEASARATAINAAIANLVNSAPGVLDTLSEIATALGNDPNLSTTLTNLIATKATPVDISTAVAAIPADAAAGTPALRSLGTTATKAAAGNDGRLSDARTPLAHHASHEVGGSDPLTSYAAKPEPLAESRITQQNTVNNAEKAATVQWNPLSIPGCDMWFDASQVDTKVVAWDTFGRANSSSAVGTAASGQVWSILNGTVGITSSQAYAPTGTGWAAIDSKAANHAAEWTVTLSASSASFRLIPRSVDSSNQIRLNVIRDGGATDTMQLVSTVAGVTTQLGITTGGLTLGETVVIRIESKGNVYNVYTKHLHGVWVLKLTATDGGSNFLTDTHQGFSLLEATTTIGRFAVSTLVPADGDGLAVWPELASATTLKYGYQATVAARPLWKTNIQNGLPGVLFDSASSQFLQTGVDAAQQPFTLFAVVSRTATGAIHAVIGADASGGLELRFESATALASILSGNVASIGSSVDAIVTSTPTICAVTYDGNGMYTFYFNGRASGISVSARTFTAGRLVRIGANQTSDYFKGYIHSIVRYSRVLLGSEMRQAFMGLSNKWGVALLPRLRPGRVRFEPAHRLRGSNIHAKQADASGADSWHTLWGSWDWAYVKDEVDKAVARGANVVRMIGSVSVVYDGTISQGTYITQLTQLVAYLQSIGVGWYHNGGDARHFAGADGPYVASFLAAQAAALVTYGSTVVAFEMLNEVGGSFDQWPEALLVDFVAQISTAVRAALPLVPLGISDASVLVQSGSANQDAAKFGDYARLAQLDAYVDFFDFHVYPANPNVTTSAFMAPYFVMSDKPMMISEFGVSRGSNDTAHMTAAYVTGKQLLTDNPGIVGVIQWAIVDDNYGLYNYAGTVQTDISTTWATFPTTPTWPSVNA